MESCPHCNFLVREGSRTCGVCHRPLGVATADGAPPAFMADYSHAPAAPASTGASVAVVGLLLLLLVFGAGAGLAAYVWP